MKVVACIVLLAGSGWLRADTLTLTTGVPLTGTLLAVTNGAYRLRMANDDFSITYVRLLPTNEVRSVLRDTPVQAAARAAYETICGYQLPADREQSPAQCARVVAALQQFLQAYPDHPTAPTVREKLALWADELAHVSGGEVKFQNRWLTPAAKVIAVRESGHQARLQTGQVAAEKVRQQIAKVEAYRTEVAKLLAIAEQNLTAAEQFLAGLHDTTEPVYEFRPTSGTPQAFPVRNGYFLWTPPFWDRYVTDEKVIVNPRRATAERRVQEAQTAANDYRSELEGSDHRLIALRVKLATLAAALQKEADSGK